ncbi:unnamed protein product, partial [Cyprideis torosa]
MDLKNPNQTMASAASFPPQGGVFMKSPPMRVSPHSDVDSEVQFTDANAPNDDAVLQYLHKYLPAISDQLQTLTGKIEKIEKKMNEFEENLSLLDNRMTTVEQDLVTRADLEILYHKMNELESGLREGLNAQGGQGAPSPWTLTAQSLTVKILKKGGEGGAPVTLRLEGATFSSEKGVVGMLSGWWWITLTDPSYGFFDPQGTLHLEVSFEGASMSTSPPPQRPTVWEAEATLQLRDFTSSLREDGDTIFSPSVHVGGKEWRVMVRRWGGEYSFRLQCNPEERSEWSLKADWTITALSAEGGGGNGEEKGDGEEVRRGRPLISGLPIPHASIARFLTEDTATGVNSANGPPDLKLNMSPLPVGSPGPISAPFIVLSTAPQCSRFDAVTRRSQGRPAWRSMTLVVEGLEAPFCYWKT